jgi:hypothetical protein
MFRRLLLLTAATVTIAVTTHAGLLWLLLWAGTTAAVTIKTTSKTQSSEARLGRLVANQGTVNNNLSAATGTVNTRVSGLSGAATGLPSGTGFYNTQGLASGSYGSTHQHTLPDFPDATHTHTLPTV